MQIAGADRGRARTGKCCEGTGTSLEHFSPSAPARAFADRSTGRCSSGTAQAAGSHNRVQLTPLLGRQYDGLIDLSYIGLDL